MDLGAFLRLGHALAGVAFVAGLVGYWFVLGMAARAESVESMRLLIRTAHPFGILVTGGGITLSILGIATSVVLGRPIFGPLQGGRVDWMFVATLLMVPLVVAIAVVYPRFGARLRAALVAAGENGPVTPELSAVWSDPIYRLARRYELAAVLAVLALMIAKPF